MIAAGYMAKTISKTPDWLNVPGVSDIYSLSNCISPAFCDYIRHWKHNGYWLFNSPSAIRELAAAEHLDLSNYACFITRFTTINDEHPGDTEHQSKTLLRRRQ